MAKYISSSGKFRDMPHLYGLFSWPVLMRFASFPADVLWDEGLVNWMISGKVLANIYQKNKVGRGGVERHVPYKFRLLKIEIK